MTALIAMVLALAAVLLAAGQSRILATIDVRPVEVAVGEDVFAEIHLRGADPSPTRIVSPVFDGLLPSGDPELREGPSGLIVTYRLRPPQNCDALAGWPRRRRSCGRRSRRCWSSPRRRRCRW